MIVEVTGFLAGKEPGHCVVDVAGVGYGVEVSRRTYDKLPEIGGSVHLYTYLIVREDSWRLVGFVSKKDRKVFGDLVGVSGVGVKGAMALIDHLGIAGIESAIQQGAWQRLKEAPGIGPKLAQRLQLELKGKWVTDAAPWEANDGLDPFPAGDEVLSALMSLGYSQQEAFMALKDVPEEYGEAERVKWALKQLDRGKGGGVSGT